MKLSCSNYTFALLKSFLKKSDFSPICCFVTKKTVMFAICFLQNLIKVDIFHGTEDLPYVWLFYAIIGSFSLQSRDVPEIRLAGLPAFFKIRPEPEIRQSLAGNPARPDFRPDLPPLPRISGQIGPTHNFFLFKFSLFLS